MSQQSVLAFLGQSFVVFIQWGWILLYLFAIATGLKYYDTQFKQWNEYGAKDTFECSTLLAVIWMVVSMGVTWFLSLPPTIAR